mmetsp:Transcript_118001/g.376215  ORF Transcript_118001/g.376215 Transcript_118001/m.376215 type:complete len:450 (+) Transcript_118001:54-1403(+)
MSRAAGLIGLRAGSRSELRATLVRAGSDTLAEGRSFLFSLLSLDQDGTLFESVSVYNFKSYVLSVGSHVQHESLVDNGVRFGSAGGAGPDWAAESVAVPSDPMVCTTEQTRTTAVLLFEDASEFFLTVEVSGGASNAGRDFFFGGRSCLVPSCEGSSDAGTPMLLGPAPPAPPAPSAPAPASDEEVHDCWRNLIAWTSEWSFKKKLWCCDNKELGCYDCSHPSEDWAPDRHDWCCRAKQVGCDLAEPDAVEAAVEKSQTKGLTAFDCGETLLSWQTSWSFEQKDWCCTNEGLGCYDCSAASSSWTGTQQDFCCRSKGIGCSGQNSEPQAPMQAEYNCQDGLDDFEFLWSDNKKAWCCAHQYLGCSSSGGMKFQRKFMQRQTSSHREVARGSLLFLGSASLAAFVTMAALGVRSRCRARPALELYVTGEELLAPSDSLSGDESSTQELAE